MPPDVATVVYVVLILALFWLDRDREARISKALWIPALWLLINGSRPVSLWLQIGPTIDSPEKYLEGSPVDALVYGTLLAAGLIVLVRRGRQVGLLLRANGPILLFFFYCALSTLWSDYPFVAFKRWTKAVGDVVMVLVLLTDPDRLSALKRVLARAGFVLVPLSVLLIKYYPDLGRSYNPWTWVPVYSGVTTTKNGLGMICLVYGLACLWCFLSAYRGQKGRERARRLIAHGIILAMAFWLLWMSNSMTSISCFIMAGGLMAMTSLIRFARKPLIVHLLVAALVSVTFSALFLGAGGGALETMGRDSSLTGRTDIWSIVLSVARNPFLGTGFESFWLGDRLQSVWNGFGLHIQEAHNGYLEVYLNGGWVGVAMLAIIIMTGYRNIIRALRENQDASCLKLGLFVAGVLYSFTEAGFRMLSPIWLAFLLAVTAVPDATAPERLPSTDIESSRQSDGLEPHLGQMINLEPSGGV
jgi:O-antigen ligase